MRKPKIGIALGGGAARGWAHIGVLKALIQAGIEPDVIAGTSIGAVVGGCYAAGKLEELEDFALSLNRRKIFGFLDFNFGGSGLISGRRLCAELDGHLKDFMISDLERRFVAVATELGSGHEIWLSKGRLVPAMHASYALPGIFRPVHLNGRWLIDGAFVNPIPVSVCRALGANVVIAVNLNADAFVKGSVIPDQEALEEDLLADAADAGPAGNGHAARRLLQRQFFGGGGSDAPGISSVMMDAFNIVQDRIARARLAGDPPDFTLTPRLGKLRLFDFHCAGTCIPAGYEAVQRDIAEIQRTLAAIAA
ncbi:MAG: patatin-like phospholipase family protein [Pseudomonadota bacterium]|nr:patatin-like phospholipase family protein [Pseudomonadota bacterium]